MRNAFIVAGVVVLVVAGVATYYLLKPATPNDFPLRPEDANVAKAQQSAPAETATGGQMATSDIRSESTPKISEDEAMDETVSSDDDEYVPRPIKVYGTVTDAATGSPITGASIFTESYQYMLDSIDDPELMDDGTLAAAGISAEELRDILVSGKPLPPDIQTAFDAVNAVTDESGAYSITVDSSMEESVYCRASSYAVASRETNERSPESMRVDFQLRKGATISGKVTNAANGEPVADVKVSVALGGNAAQMPWLMMESDSMSNATTEADGTYSVDGLSAGQNAVIVQDEVHGWLFDQNRTVNVTLAEGEEKLGVDLVVTEGLRVEGTITNEEGQPVEGARISATPIGNDLMEMTFSRFGRSSPLFSDGSGHYMAIGLRPGKNSITAHHRDYASATSEVTLVEKEVAPHVDFTLAKGSAVSGIAKYEDGTPAVGEWIALFIPTESKVPDPFDFDPYGETEVTDEETGEFTFENVPAGEYIVSSGRMYRMDQDKEAGTDKAMVPVRVDGKNPVTGLQLTIAKDKSTRDPAGAIAGTVLDREGNPAPNVGVWAVSKDDETFSFGKSSDPDRFTDKSGAFTLDDIDGDSFTVYAEGDKGEASQPNVTPGDKITLRLGPLTSVSGVVVDSNGEAVPGCKVELTEPKTGEAETMATMMTRMLGSFMPGGGEGETTDDFGQFTFKHIDAGNYILEAKSASKGFGASEQFAVVKGTEKNGIRVVLEAGASFAGIVVDGSGSPVQGANVSLIESMGGPMEDIMSNLPMGMGPTAAAVATTGADGAFTLNGVKHGTFTLSAKHADFAPFTAKGVDVSSSQSSPYRVTLGKGGSARGQFLADGQPKANVMIQLMGPGGMQMAMTDSEGRFEVKGLPAGTYMVMPMDIAAMQQGGEDSMPNINFKSVEITEGGDVVIPFGGGVAVTGSVPAEHLSKMTFVYLMRKGAPDMSSMLGGLDPMDMMGTGMQVMQYMAGMAEVKDDGSFTLSNIDPGEYDLRVYASDVNMDEIDPEAYMNMSFEEMQQQSQAFMPKEVFKQPITVGEQPLTVEFAAPKTESAP